MVDRRKIMLEFVVEVVDNGYLVKFGEGIRTVEAPTVVFCGSYSEVGDKVASIVDKVVELPTRKIDSLTYL